MAETLRFDLLANDRASNTFDKVGRAAGDTESKFGKAAAGLAKFGKAAAIGLGVGAAAAGVALFKMTQGAIEDEAAQKKLAKTLENTAGATKGQVAGVEDWITTLGKMYGIADDEVRPAMARLATATGDVGKAQGLTRLAMDVSAGTGKSLEQVSTALMKAQNGQVSALSRLGVNTKNAAGETISMEQAQRRLADTFGGQATTQANTLQGKMDRLKLILSEAGETIGAKVIPMVSSMADWFLNKGVPAIQSTYEMLKDKFGPTISSIGGWISDTLVPAIQTFVGQMKSGEGAGGRFADVLERAGAAVKATADFLNEHRTAVVGVTTAVLAGVAAYKAFMIIDSIMATVKTGIVLYKAWQAGTLAQTAAQMGLNSALLANPLGLVVGAVAALAVGLVIAYKKSETFRDIVDTAFRVIGRTGSWLWDNALKPAFSALEKGFEAVGKAGTWLWNNALQPAFKFIVNGVGNILDMWSSMLGVLGKVPGFGWAKDAAEAMGKAADKAHAMAEGITKIPPRKDVKIVVTYAYQGKRNPGKEDQLDILPRGQVETESIKLGELLPQGFAGGVKAKIKTVIAAVGELVSRSNDKLQTLKDKAKEIATGVADAMRGALDVGGLGGTDADGNTLNVTDQLASFAAQSGQFAAALAAAAGKGLNSGLIQKIAQLGPMQGLTAAQALAAMDQAQVASANASLAAVDKYANELGQTVLTTTSLPGDIEREQANHDALVAILSDLKNNPGNINITVNDATDPDRVVAAIRRYVKRNGKLHGVAAKDD